MTWSDAARKASAEARRRKKLAANPKSAPAAKKPTRKPKPAPAAAHQATPPVTDRARSRRRYNSPNADRSTWQPLNMPPRKAADVWLAPDNNELEQPAEPTTTEPQPVPTVIDTPPGPIQLEIRVNNRNVLAQRVYRYSIDQTHPNRTVITAHLTPPAVRND